MARKREDKTRQESGNSRKHRAPPNSPNQDKSYISIKHQLSAMGLTLREIPGDGNCLFGALADQLDGTSKTHLKHRQAVVSYMRNHREDFEPFVEDDVPFERHLSNLAELGTYGGNECIVAFARLQNVKVIIHQLNAPLWQIDGTEEKENVKELHISYHNGDHYNSVRRLGDCSSSPPKIKLTVQESASDTSDKKSSVKSHQLKAEAFPYYDGFSNHLHEGPINHLHEGPINQEEDDPLAATSEELADLEKSSNDLENVRICLDSSDYDIHEAFNDHFNFLFQDRVEEVSRTANGNWDSDGSANRIFDEDCPDSCLYPQRDSHIVPTHNSTIETLQAKLKNHHLSNSKKKELKKQLRKQQAHDTKRQQYRDKMSSNDCSSSAWGNVEESPEVIIVKDIGCLSI